MSLYSLETKSVIYRHPDVLEAAVIGVPDPQWGEALKAGNVLKPGGKLDSVELLSFAKSGGRRTKCRSRGISSSRCYTWKYAR